MSHLLVQSDVAGKGYIAPDMAERRRSSAKSPKSAKKSSGKSPSSDLNSEEAAKRRAALENAIRRKIEREKKALQIVERLLEDDVTEDFLLDCARFISSAHYKDAVEERFIVKLCGYPICKNKLEKVLKQKYWISTKSNKVYDITERKCFCSNFCFRASKYYEAQIPQSPIWTREEESGWSGMEVKFSEKLIKTSEIEKVTSLEENDRAKYADRNNEVTEPEPAFVSSIISVDGLSHDHTETPDQNRVQSDETVKTPNSNGPSKVLTEVTEKLNLCHLGDCDGNLPKNEPSDSPVLSHETVLAENAEKSPESSEIEIFDITQRAVSKRGAEQLRKLICSSSHYQSAQRNQIPVVAAKGTVLEVLTQTLNEWKTEETLKFLHGSNYMVEFEPPKKDLRNGKDSVEELDEDDLSLDTNDLENNFEISGGKSKNSLDECLPSYSDRKVEKPAPHYAKLQEETEILNLKVREFFRGNYMLPEEVEQGYHDVEKTSTNPKSDTSWVPALPLVDSCSQQQIRRRIVLEKLKKVLPAVLLPLQITYSNVSKELHSLVKTLQFTNQNITHTMLEWSIIAIVLLSALLPTMAEHKDCQKNSGYTQFISKFLEELHFERQDLEFLKHKFASNTMTRQVMHQ
ncbi:putative RNA polymerase II subunit B1 CTD phosphatase RPAP2 isoform X2 [Pelobates fuscus]|uniref:putative RNA polymerase II subunit B1 CTD phosphatase RPAP2 isoform X2 n=1 Tax=Pelobates fuscus TaxID=191477 RepID=UPI002FE42CD3